MMNVQINQLDENNSQLRFSVTDCSSFYLNCRILHSYYKRDALLDTARSSPGNNPIQIKTSLDFLKDITIDHTGRGPFRNEVAARRHIHPNTLNTMYSDWLVVTLSALGSTPHSQGAFTTPRSQSQFFIVITPKISITSLLNQAK